jgi:hypothetical protein
MCHVTAGKSGTQQNSLCACGCACPAALTAGDEIKSLEDHRTILQDRIAMIDRKIAGPKTQMES